MSMLKSLKQQRNKLNNLIDISNKKEREKFLY